MVEHGSKEFESELKDSGVDNNIRTMFCSSKRGGLRHLRSSHESKLRGSLEAKQSE
jgi:hypothetical protein